MKCPIPDCKTCTGDYDYRGLWHHLEDHDIVELAKHIAKAEVIALGEKDKHG